MEMPKESLMNLTRNAYRLGADVFNMISKSLIIDDGITEITEEMKKL